MNKLTYILIVLLISFHSDIIASEWVQKADFGGVGRHRGTGIAIGNKGYMGLGHYNGAGPNIILNDWWEFDPASNSWAQKANYPGGNGVGSYGVISYGTPDYGYVGGGQVGVTGEFFRFDPATNTWTAMASTPTSAMNTTGFAIGDNCYYISGNQLYEFVATSNIWITKNPVPFSNGIWNSAFVIDNKGYIKYGTSLWEYKPSLDQWASRASFPGTATAGSVGFTQNGKGYIVSGYAGWLSEVRDEVWGYNPGTNSWDSLPEFTGSSRRFSSGFNIGNRCYIGTGTNGTNFADFWEFDALAGLSETFDISQFDAYPNPSVDYISFESDNLNQFKVIVFDNLGQLIFSDETQNHKVIFNKENNKSGLYFYKIMVENKEVHCGKFIFK